MPYCESCGSEIKHPVKGKKCRECDWPYLPQKPKRQEPEKEAH
jgi:hypothetical protein